MAQTKQPGTYYRTPDGEKVLVQTNDDTEGSVPKGFARFPRGQVFVHLPSGAVMWDRIPVDWTRWDDDVNTPEVAEANAPEAPQDVSELAYNDLVKLAGELGIEKAHGTRKEQLVEQVKAALEDREPEHVPEPTESEGVGAEATPPDGRNPDVAGQPDESKPAVSDGDGGIADTSPSNQDPGGETPTTGDDENGSGDDE